MGVCLQALTLRDETIRRLIEEPPLVWRVIAPDDPQAYLDAVGQPVAAGLFARLFGSRAPAPLPVPVPELTFTGGELRELDLDKAWDDLDTCLGRILPAGRCKNFFNDGEPVGDIEIGYGPGLCLYSHEVAAIAASYRAVSQDALLAAARAEKDTGDYLAGYFEDLKQFLDLAAEDKLGVLVQYT